MDHSPGLPQQPTEPTEPKENDILRVSEIVEDFRNLKMGFGQFHFTIELKRDIVGGMAALQVELEKLGVEKKYVGTIKIVNKREDGDSSKPLPKGIYYCRYWKGRNGIHAEVMEQSKKDAQDKDLENLKRIPEEQE